MTCFLKNKPITDGYFVMESKEVVSAHGRQGGTPVWQFNAVWIDNLATRECMSEEKTVEMCSGCERYKG